MPMAQSDRLFRYHVGDVVSEWQCDSLLQWWDSVCSHLCLPCLHHLSHLGVTKDGDCTEQFEGVDL